MSYRRDGVVLGIATGVFGVAFGVLAATSHLSLAKAMAMSLLVFTGASQFAAVSVAAAGGSPLGAVGGALLLAARNAIYGVALSDRLRRYPWPIRLLAAQLVIDESTAMALAQRDEGHSRRAFWITGLSVFVFWNVGTAIGATVGSHLADPAALGLDAAFPAGFVALLVPQVRRRAGRAAALAGAVLALCGLLFLPSGGPILLAALGVIAGVVVQRREPRRPLRKFESRHRATGPTPSDGMPAEPAADAQPLAEEAARAQPPTEQAADAQPPAAHTPEESGAGGRSP